MDSEKTVVLIELSVKKRLQTKSMIGLFYLEYDLIDFGSILFAGRPFLFIQFYEVTGLVDLINELLPWSVGLTKGVELLENGFSPLLIIPEVYRCRFVLKFLYRTKQLCGVKAASIRRRLLSLSFQIDSDVQDSCRLLLSSTRSSVYAPSDRPVYAFARFQ